MYSNTRSLTVGEIMSFPVITSSANDNIRSIANKMKKHDISGVVIVDRENTPLGIITAGDIVRRAAVRRGAFLFAKAKHVMSKPVHSITREKALEEAARQMADNKVKSLCVVDGVGKLVGIITEEDITKNASYLIEVLNEMVRTGFVKKEGTAEGML
jgi:CBS domain-containing protein